MKYLLIGGGTSNQGIGPWLAHHLKSLGAYPRYVLSHSIDSASKSVADLKQKLNTETIQPLANLTGLEDPIDFLVIASPRSSHLDYLRWAQNQKIPVFCEKPLVDLRSTGSTEVIELVQAFQDQGTHLLVNTQWVETLTVYKLIHPSLSESPQTFEMTLSPACLGRDMLDESLPHALSLIETMVGTGTFKDLSETWQSEKAVTVAGHLLGEKADLKFTIDICHCLEQPRPLSYGFDGLKVDRKLDMANYSMSFISDTGIFPIKDPLLSRLETFISALTEGTNPIQFDSIKNQILLLEQILNP